MESQGRSASAGPLLPGDPASVGPYEIRGRIGAGGMGAVYLGRGPDGRSVAVKVIRPELAGDDEFAARFRDEVANAERVASFSTAQVLDHGAADGRAYMVTEFIEGPSLARYVSDHGALSPGMLHGVAIGVAAALVAIHSADLVHRDLKPANVLLSISGPRVIDFGIARALDAASSHTMTGQLVGSPGWMAPEQVLRRPMSTAVDIFAWGCLLAYAGTGRHPYGRGDLQSMAVRVVHTDPEIGPLPAPLDRLVRAALVKEPTARPTAEELLLALVGGRSAVATAAAARETVRDLWEPPAPRPAPAEVFMTPSEPTTTRRPAPPREPAPLREPTISREPTMPRGPTRPQEPTRPREPAQALTEPPAPVSPAGPRRTRRRLALIASGVAAAVTAAVVGWAVTRSDTPSATPAAAAAPAPLPADPLLVRVDTAAGWPRECHAHIARTAPGADDPRRLAQGSSCDTLPEWSRDRRSIAFTRRDGDAYQVWVMKADGSGATMVTDRIAGGRVAWAPDGRRLAFVGKVGDDRELFVIGVDGSNLRRLTTSPAVEDDPAWSPDGRRLAFWSRRDGAQQIYVLDPANPAAPWTRLTSAPVSAADPVFSPDGKRIAYTHGRADGQADIWVMNADGSDAKPLTGDSAHEMDPTWSPGGTWIAYTRGPVAEPRVWAVRADGTGARAVTSGSRREGHPAWS
jgi:serine/threonine protein kinase